MSVETLGHVFQKICVRVGIPKKFSHLHVMCHTCAHRLLEEGNTARRIAAYIEHSSSKTTEKYYLKDSTENITNTMQKPIQWTKQSSNQSAKNKTLGFANKEDSKEDNTTTEKSKSPKK